MYDPNGFDEKDLHQVAQIVSSHSAWQVTDDIPTPETIAAASSPVELWLAHDTTDSVLRFNIPSRELDSAAVGTLSHSFVNPEPRSRDSSQFLKKLSEAHFRIVEQHSETDYVSAQSDSTDIIKITVPIDYTESNIYEALSAADQAAQESQRLHNKILELVDSYSQCC